LFPGYDAELEDDGPEPAMEVSGVPAQAPAGRPDFAVAAIPGLTAQEHLQEAGLP